MMRCTSPNGGMKPVKMPHVAFHWPTNIQVSCKLISVKQVFQYDSLAEKQFERYESVLTFYQNQWQLVLF